MRKAKFWADGRQLGSYPEVGFGEIAPTVPFAPDPFSKDVLEADFWTASLKVHPGHNFRIARDTPLFVDRASRKPGQGCRLLTCSNASRDLRLSRGSGRESLQDFFGNLRAPVFRKLLLHMATYSDRQVELLQERGISRVVVQALE